MGEGSVSVEAERLLAIQHEIRALEERQWRLGLAGCVIVVLLAAALCLLMLPAILQIGPVREDAVVAIIGLAVLFITWSIFQQAQVRSMRQRMARQFEALQQERERAERYARLSMIDPLTNLLNRRFLEDHLQNELARAERSGQPLAILAIDINDFKRINDRYGHAAGDVALQTVADHLRQAVRKSDIPVRLGGDEFLVVLPNCPIGQAPIERLTPVVTECDGNTVEITLASGCVEHQAGQSAAQLLARADAELYRAKWAYHRGQAAEHSPIAQFAFA